MNGVIELVHRGLNFLKHKLLVTMSVSFKSKIIQISTEAARRMNI